MSFVTRACTTVRTFFRAKPDSYKRLADHSNPLNGKQVSHSQTGIHLKVSASHKITAPSATERLLVVNNKIVGKQAPKSHPDFLPCFMLPGLITSLKSVSLLPYTPTRHFSISSSRPYWAAASKTWDGVFQLQDRTVDGRRCSQDTGVSRHPIYFQERRNFPSQFTLQSYTSQWADQISHTENRCIISFGCGNAIKPLVDMVKGGFKGTIIGLDFSSEAIDSAKKQLEDTDLTPAQKSQIIFVQKPMEEFDCSRDIPLLTQKQLVPSVFIFENSIHYVLPKEREILAAHILQMLPPDGMVFVRSPLPSGRYFSSLQHHKEAVADEPNAFLTQSVYQKFLTPTDIQMLFPELTVVYGFSSRLDPLGQFGLGRQLDSHSCMLLPKVSTLHFDTTLCHPPFLRYVKQVFPPALLKNSQKKLRVLVVGNAGHKKMVADLKAAYPGCKLEITVCKKSKIPLKQGKPFDVILSAFDCNAPNWSGFERRLLEGTLQMDMLAAVSSKGVVSTSIVVNPQSDSTDDVRSQNLEKLVRSFGRKSGTSFVETYGFINDQDAYRVVFQAPVKLSVQADIPDNLQVVPGLFVADSPVITHEEQAMFRQELVALFRTVQSKSETQLAIFHGVTRQESIPVPVVLDPSKPPVTISYFSEYGEPNHGLLYFPADIMPSSASSLFESLLTRPDVQEVLKANGLPVEREKLQVKFTINGYGTGAGFDFHQDLSTNGELTFVVIVGPHRETMTFAKLNTDTRFQGFVPHGEIAKAPVMFETPLDPGDLTIIAGRAYDEFAHNVQVHPNATLPDSAHYSLVFGVKAVL